MTNSLTERHFPCASCGADLRFAPGQTHLRCAHCGHEQDIPAAPEVRLRALNEHDLHSALREALPPAAMEEAPTTRCPGCGAL
ncbi:MAG: primosomal protein N' (replication factor Y) - superfamily II helicase, partial [Gemmobacter sp.]|nr:primosomal protein N' (replication factor Y) - superfamily II helicase [Gemmobacter sp.]